MRDTSTVLFRFFSVRIAAVFLIAALFLFFGGTTARAQDVAGDEDEIIFDEEFGDDEVFDAETLDEEAAAEDEEAVAEDEGGFFSAIGDALRNVGSAIGDAASAVGDAVTGALEAVGLGGDEEPSAEEEEAEEEGPPVVADDEEAMSPEDIDVEAPTAAPRTSAFALRVVIAARDVAAVLAATESQAATRYEPRSFEIPERGLLTLRAMQDGPLFCLAFDLSEFRVAAALSDASFEVNGGQGAAEDVGVNTACVDLQSLSATAPFLIEAVFK